MYIAHILNRSYHVEFLSHILPNAFLLYYPSEKADGINPVFKLPTRPMSTPDTVGEVKSFFSPTVSRSITGSCISGIEETPKKR